MGWSLGGTAQVRSSLAIDLDDCNGIVSWVKRSVAKQTEWCPHTPHPKQEEFLRLNTQEALFGGATGGGKSDALLMAALQNVDIPGYSALLLRRTYPELTGPAGLIARAHEWLQPTKARWNAERREWRFPSGAVVQFGYMDSEQDRYRYQGAEYQFIGWDELTHFPEDWYLWMFSRLRKTKDLRVTLRVRGASNPGNIGHEWVKARFIDPPHPDRPFVPSLLVDNPSIDASYLASLALLDEATRRQFELGIWDVDSAGLVYRYDEERNGIDVVPQCTQFVLGVDFGIVRDPTAFTIVGWRQGDPNVYVIRSWTRDHATPSEVAEEIQALTTSYKFTRIVGDANGLGKAYTAESVRRFNLPIERADKENKLGYIKLMNGDFERGRIRVVRGSCAGLIKQWKSLPWTKRTDERGNVTESEARGFQNDQCDATLYSWRASLAFHQSHVKMTLMAIKGPFIT